MLYDLNFVSSIQHWDWSVIVRRFLPLGRPRPLPLVDHVVLLVLHSPRSLRGRGCCPLLLAHFLLVATLAKRRWRPAP
jgi:hypothetical protein